jgi:hypothetical protein
MFLVKIRCLSRCSCWSLLCAFAGITQQYYAANLQMSQNCPHLQRSGECEWFGVIGRCGAYTILLAILGPFSVGDFLLTIIMVCNFGISSPKAAERTEKMVANLSAKSSALQLLLGSEMSKTLSWKKRCAHTSLAQLDRELHLSSRYLISTAPSDLEHLRASAHA